MVKARFSSGVVVAVMALVTVVALASAACGPAAPKAAAPSSAGPASAGPASTAPASTAPSSTGPAPAGGRCAAEAAAGTQVRFRNDAGTRLAGVVMGTGRTGVILAHQVRGDVCQWLWYATALAGAGYRVLAFDFTGDGASGRGTGTPADDTVAAVTFLRGQGVAKLALVGASKGGNAVLGAAARATPPVDAVVALSAPARFDAVDAV